MITSLTIRNFTVFPEASLAFGRNLNVFVGENGAGKTHLLKLAYSVLAVSAEEGRKPAVGAPTKALLQARIGEKLLGVFRPETVGRLARRRQGKTRCDVALGFTDPIHDISFGFASQATREVRIGRTPQGWIDTAPAYLPTRELLTIYPGFVSLYNERLLEFEETWHDTCDLLGRALKRGTKEPQVRRLLEPLEAALGGSLELDKNGRFYLVTTTGRMEVPLVAEGLRKLGMLARLVANGSLPDKGCLFWDEPEANLNSRLITRVAQTIVDLSESGIQVFIATHSLFLLREMEILLAQRPHTDNRFFGLRMTDAGVRLEQGPTPDEMGAIAALEEELAQSDRFLAQAAAQ